jgi:hypothetical protein
MKLVTAVFCGAFLIGASYYSGSGKAGTATHENNNYWLEVALPMYEGYGDGPTGEYPGGSDVMNLFGSYCWVGVDGNAPSTVSNSGDSYYNEFVTLQSDIYTTDGYWPGGLDTYGDFDTYVLCDDSNAGEAGPIPITIARQTWSFTSSDLDDFVGFKYIVRNDSSNTYDDLYITHIADFDIGGSLDYIDDVIGCDVGRSMPYMYDSNASPDNYLGIVPGDEDWISVGMQYWDIGTDPVDDATRLSLQQNSGWFTENTPYDYRIVLTFHYDGDDFGPGETIVAGFYQVAGMSLTELQANADAAVASYQGGGGWVNIKSASLGEIKAMFK